MSEVDLLIKELSVRRLNRWGETEMICSKAAEALKELSDEIDRLRAEDEAIRAEFGGKRDGRPTIECLREAFAAKWSAEDTLFHATLNMKTGELWAEVERLNSVLREGQIQAIDAETESARLAAENEKLRAALEPFASMGKAVMGRKHHNEAVISYALAPTVKIHHFVAAHLHVSALQDKSDE